MRPDPDNKRGGKKETMDICSANGNATQSCLEQIGGNNYAAFQKYICGPGAKSGARTN
jgi:hypothetical protein